MTTALRPTPLLAHAADDWFADIADPVEQALAVLRWAGETFGDDFAVTSSMADGLLAHLASRFARLGGASIQAEPSLAQQRPS